MMELNNTLSKFTDTSKNGVAVRKESIEIMVKCLSPVIPHLCHHLWLLLGGKEAVVDANWPVVDESALIQDNIQIIAQVNGKLRAKMMIPLNSDNQKVQELAFADEGVSKHIEGKEIIKVIVVPNKLINVVVR